MAIFIIILFLFFTTILASIMEYMSSLNLNPLAFNKIKIYY